MNHIFEKEDKCTKNDKSLGRISYIRIIVLFSFSLALGWAAIILARPPKASEADLSENCFSLKRALRHIEKISVEAHPRGSTSNANVRDYLLAELRTLGYDSKVERSFSSWDVKTRGLPIENIVARKSGSANSRAVMLCAHYDSVAGGPGASDDAASVGSILEALRSLQSQKSLKNDIIVLFTDGEENGLLGGKAFAFEHPWMKDVGLVFNFDARGTSGASIMFETTRGNLSLIREFAIAVPNIRSTSLSTFVYDRMPNGTDFTNFKKAGIPGLNFAFIEGSQHYHKPSDTISNLNRDTLQHTGNTILSLARHFGNIGLPLPSSGDAVYFNPLGSWIFVYPQSWVLGLNIFLSVISALILWEILALNLIKFARVVFSVCALILCVGFVSVLAYVSHWVPFADRLSLVVCLSVCVTLLFGYIIRSRCNPVENLAGSLICWSTLSVFSGFLVPPGSYVFLVPAVTGWLGLAISEFAMTRKNAAVIYRVLRYASLVGPIVSIVLWSPLCRIIYIALPLSLPAMAMFTVLACWPLQWAAFAAGSAERRAKREEAIIGI